MRTALAVGVGAVTIAALAGTGLHVAWLRLGPYEAVASPDWDAAPSWVATSFGVTLVSAIAGGYVSAWIAHAMRPSRILSALLFASLLLKLAWTTFHPASLALRATDAGVVDALLRLREPLWVQISIPFAGATGVLLGAMRRLRHEESTAAGDDSA